MNCKHQFNQSTTNNSKRLTSSFSALYMKICRACHITELEWVECVQNVSVPDPSIQSFILKGGVFLPK